MKKFKKTFVFSLIALASIQAAAGCLTSVNDSKILGKLVSLNSSYGDVPSTVSCANPKGATEKIICSSDRLQALELLDTKAYVFAVENATGSAVSHKKIKDVDWIKKIRNQCHTKECLCEAFKSHTEDSGVELSED